MTSTQQSILTMVVNSIMSTDRKHFQKEIDALISANKELLGPDTADGFIYGTKWFPGSMMYGQANQSLHSSLVPQAERLMTHLKNMDDNQKIMSQILGKLLESCPTMQDMRDELPEVIISLDPLMWSQLSRTRDPAQSIQSNPRALRQYQKVLDKVHTYCAMRYLL